MGLLDDAIKEHLELKRKHGAPEEEVQRQEEEALGPVRRDAAQQPEGEEAEVLEAGTDGAPAAEEAEFATPDAEETAFAAPDAEEAEFAAPAAELPFDGEPSEEAFPATDEPYAAEAELPSGDTPPRGFAPAEEAEAGATEAEPPVTDPGETQEYDPFADEGAREGADADSAEEADEGEEGDVLEDTPDFLQETPEHDRLWFEQKPPRDFDFD
jgi:hypothetical protein